MRFSAVQDNSYGVGLPQDRFLGNADETMMATANNTELKDDRTMDEGPMVSNLPLLFANGYPTSLEKITLAQLERFITFMVQCSLGHDTAENITEPQWWPKEVKFSNPLTRPKKVTESWMANLKKLVFRCYTYHRSEYLLRFCSCLARYPHEELEYVNNWDSTTSLYHKSTGKLLVTFRNENMNYDKRNESPRKKLLSHNGAASSNSNKTKQQLHSRIMVEPPTEDIYLCDNCDAEFTGLEKMKEHERVCCEQEQASGNEGNNNSRPNTPDLSTIKPELQQNQFLEYFHLSSTKVESKPKEADTVTTVNNNIVRRTSRRVRGSINFTRCPTIPFSSPAGMLLAKKSKVMTKETQQERLERIERHLFAPVLDSSCRPKWLDADTDRDRWIVTHKPNRDKPTDDYVHQYRFVNSVKNKPISVNKKESSTGTKTKGYTHVSSKRKAPGDEDNVTVREAEDITTTKMSTGTLSAYKIVEQPKDSEGITEPPKDSAVCLQPPSTITLIDLCSSDEEHDQSTSAASDENRDPMNSGSGPKKVLVRKPPPTKFCPKPCIYNADPTSEWLPDNVLNDDGENCVNKYRSSVMLNTCAHLSPILRPAP